MPATCSRLVRDCPPLRKMTALRGTDKASARTRISSSFAAPSTGRAARRTACAAPGPPATTERLAPGRAWTTRSTPPSRGASHGASANHHRGDRREPVGELGEGTDHERAQELEGEHDEQRREI